MKSIIKNIVALTLCVSFTSSSAAYAESLNSISITKDEITSKQSVSTEDVNNVIFSDINGNWAEQIIKEAVEIGLVSGYDDGTFKPDNQVTRAEFATLLNNAMKINLTTDINLWDVNKSDWFYQEVEKSLAVGFFNGYLDDTFKPNNPITREEAAKVVASAITTGEADGEGATLLEDYSTIQEWAKSSVDIAFNKGYIIGYPEGLYMPTKALNRAEAVKIIYTIVDNENIEQGFNITNLNESYNEAVVSGDLNILDSVGTSIIKINNVTVLGDIVIFAKDIDSVILTDVNARSIIVKDNSNPVTIVCNDNINIKSTQLPSVAVIKKQGSNINI
jgi:hypothetical protein